VRDGIGLLFVEEDRPLCRDASELVSGPVTDREAEVQQDITECGVHPSGRRLQP
jgi:hypothetical protein